MPNISACFCMRFLIVVWWYHIVSFNSAMPWYVQNRTFNQFTHISIRNLYFARTKFARLFVTSDTCADSVKALHARPITVRTRPHKGGLAGATMARGGCWHRPQSAPSARRHHCRRTDRLLFFVSGWAARGPRAGTQRRLSAFIWPRDPATGAEAPRKQSTVAQKNGGKNLSETFQHFNWCQGNHQQTVGKIWRNQSLPLFFLDIAGWKCSAAKWKRELSPIGCVRENMQELGSLCYWRQLHVMLHHDCDFRRCRNWKEGKNKRWSV